MSEEKKTNDPSASGEESQEVLDARAKATQTAAVGAMATKLQSVVNFSQVLGLFTGDNAADEDGSGSASSASSSGSGSDMWPSAFSEIFGWTGSLYLDFDISAGLTYMPFIWVWWYSSVAFVIIWVLFEVWVIEDYSNPAEIARFEADYVYGWFDRRRPGGCGYTRSLKELFMGLSVTGVVAALAFTVGNGAKGAGVLIGGIGFFVVLWGVSQLGIMAMAWYYKREAQNVPGSMTLKFICKTKTGACLSLFLMLYMPITSVTLESMIRVYDDEDYPGVGCYWMAFPPVIGSDANATTTTLLDCHSTGGYSMASIGGVLFVATAMGIPWFLYYLLDTTRKRMCLEEGIKRNAANEIFVPAFERFEGRHLVMTRKSLIYGPCQLAKRGPQKIRWDTAGFLSMMKPFESTFYYYNILLLIEKFLLQIIIFTITDSQSELTASLIILSLFSLNMFRCGPYVDAAEDHLEVVCRCTNIINVLIGVLIAFDVMGETLGAYILIPANAINIVLILYIVDVTAIVGMVRGMINGFYDGKVISHLFELLKNRDLAALEAWDSKLLSVEYGSDVDPADKEAVAEVKLVQWARERNLTVCNVKTGTGMNLLHAAVLPKEAPREGEEEAEEENDKLCKDVTQMQLVRFLSDREDQVLRGAKNADNCTPAMTALKELAKTLVDMDLLYAKRGGGGGGSMDSSASGASAKPRKGAKGLNIGSGSVSADEESGLLSEPLGADLGDEASLEQLRAKSQALIEVLSYLRDSGPPAVAVTKDESRELGAFAQQLGAIYHIGLPAPLVRGWNAFPQTGLRLFVGELLGMVAEADFTGVDAGPVAGAAIGEALHGVEATRSLVLRDNGLSTPGGVALAAALEHNTSVALLDVSGNGFDGNVGRLIAGALPRNRALRVLDLSRNAMGAEAGRAFADVLGEHVPMLEELFLAETGIGAGNCASIVAEVARARALRVLDLSGNGINDEENFGRGLSQCETLVKLYLRNNAVGPTVAACMSKGLGAVEVLDLASNNLGVMGALALQPWLGRPACPLRWLDVSRNALGAGGVMALAENDYPVLAYLNASFNDADAASGKALANRLHAPDAELKLRARDLRVTDLQVAKGDNGHLYVHTRMTCGDRWFSDRENVLADTIPVPLRGWSGIRTANDDKDISGRVAEHVTFAPDAPVIVLVMFTNRAPQPAPWLKGSGWHKTKLVAHGYTAYARFVAAGEQVVFGGNKVDKSKNMYWALLAEGLPCPRCDFMHAPHPSWLDKGAAATATLPPCEMCGHQMAPQDHEQYLGAHLR